MSTPEADDAGDTRDVSAAHRLDEAALSRWLTDHVPGFSGPIKLRMFKGGQSNPTYRVDTPQQSYVLRAKPGPASRLLASAHAIDREFRVMTALRSTDVPVAEALALCEDESVVGRAFYVMAHVAGRVLWDPSLPGMDPTQRRAIYEEMNRVLAALHRVNTETCGLTDYGRPGNYFERQIARWTRQYQASALDPIPAMDALIDWLPGHIPPGALDDSQACLVHGDFRIDNLIFHSTESRVIAVLDWELSTLGHPLADFSYHCMSWHIPPGVFRGMAGVDLAALGIPDERHYIDRYCQRTGRTDAAALRRDWPFYLAYNLFRIAAILQGIARRVHDGTASSDQARQAAAGARPLAELGWQFARRHAAPS